ncbi:MAG: hypothetical protein EXR20_09730 [Bacteroidetes bacterium]|nr:hypothetical protein [Bacteroidota bacterium]
MKKNAVVIIIIAIILILIGVAVYLFVKGSKKGKNLDKDGKIIDPTKDKDGKLLLLEKTPEVTPTTTPTTTTPTPTPTPTYTAPKLLDCTTDAFPMGMGAKNQCVQRLQKKLNLVDDGKFGKNTNTAVVALGYVVPLTEADFDRIIAGLKPEVVLTTAQLAAIAAQKLNPQNLKVLDFVNAKNSTGVYSSNTMVKRYPQGNVEGILSGTLKRGYYGGRINQIDTLRGVARVTNNTYKARDANNNDYTVYWMKLKDLELR